MSSPPPLLPPPTNLEDACVRVESTHLSHTIYRWNRHNLQKASCWQQLSFIKMTRPCARQSTPPATDPPPEAIPPPPLIRHLYERTDAGLASLMAAQKLTCPLCHGHFSSKTVRRHVRGRCTQAAHLARQRDTAVQRLLNPIQQRAQAKRRRRNLPAPAPARARTPIPASPPPSRDSSPHIATPPPDLPVPHLGDEAETVADQTLRHPDFAFDTPGAGPSNAAGSSRAGFFDAEPLVAFEPPAEGPSFAERAPWLEGMSAQAVLEQEIEAEVTRHGGRKLSERDMRMIRGLNFKVDSDLTAKAYGKLPRAFPELATLPDYDTTRRRVACLSGIRGVRIDCCIDSCVAFTGPYETSTECPYCGKSRYRSQRSQTDRLIPRKQFQYLPLIPRLVNAYLDPQTARLFGYRSERRRDGRFVSDIFDGQHYRRLCGKRVTVAGRSLPHVFFSQPTDIALGLSTDGFGPFKSRKKTCWPLLAFNYNVPPHLRFQLQHLLCLGVIPGPAQPKELCTFLQPFLDELEDLAVGVPAFDGSKQRAFNLHAYLLVCFGDMPAVAKLMCMKGHNGKSPCRACRLRGVRNPQQGGRGSGANNRTNYTPLARPFAIGRHNPRQYDPLDLPHRSHREFLRHAQQVESAPNDAEENRRSRHYGINSLSPLARLASIEFPTSFPHDFMHAVFENVIPTLISLWTRSKNFKTFGTGREDYILQPDVWQAIGAACATSGDTIPAIFGCRVPNLSTDRYQSTSESTLLFATLLAPGLLRKQFTREAYYEHFIELVRLINLCLDLTIRHIDIDAIRKGFADWVTEFEKLYYRHKPDRLRVCTLPIHSLLHIADDIEMMGPVWCYWAFPMERFCGALARTKKNQQFPFASLDRHVLEVAQLSQVKIIYNLTEELDLDDRRGNIATGTTYDGYRQSVFVRPRRPSLIHDRITKKLAAYLSAITDVNESVVRQHLKGREFVHWGKMQQIIDPGGGDIIRGHALEPDTERAKRDASYVKYQTRVDRLNRSRPQPVNHAVPGYGRVEYFLIVDIQYFQELACSTGNSELLPFLGPLALAVVSPIPSFKRLPDANIITYTLAGKKLAPEEIVDVEDLQCLVGRVPARDGTWFIADRTTVVGRLDLVEELADHE